MPRIAPEMPRRLAAAAFGCFSASGIKGVNLDRIAVAAGVTKGSLYSHYRSKRELILAACEHYYRSYRQRVARETDSIDDPPRRLRAVLELSVRTCVADRANRVFTTEIFALGLQDRMVRNSWAGFYDQVRRMYIDLLIAAPQAGQANPDDARAAVDLMLAAMEGIKQRAAFEPQHMIDPEQQERIVAGLMGILETSLTPFGSHGP